MLVEKTKSEAIKLVQGGQAYMVEIREKFPGSTYVFFLDGNKWLVLKDGKPQGKVERRNVINAIINADKDWTISVAWQTVSNWADPFIEFANSVLNVIRRPCVLQFQLTDGPETITTYEMPVRKTNVFQLVASAKERKFDIIEYLGHTYHLVGWDKMRIKGKYVFRLTLDRQL